MQTWLGTTSTRLPSGSRGAPARSATTAVLGEQDDAGVGVLEERPNPEEYAARSAPSALLPASRTSRPPAWLTTVERQVRAMSSGSIVPSSHCWASPKT